MLANSLIVLGVLVAMGFAITYALYIFRWGGISSLIATKENTGSTGAARPSVEAGSDPESAVRSRPSSTV